MGVNLVIVVALILLNGLFALAELAVVSSRRARLQALADRNRRGAQSALALHADPGRFLSSVQIGITLIGILSGAYSGASLGGPVGERLVLLGLPIFWLWDTGSFPLVLLGLVVLGGRHVPPRLDRCLALVPADPRGLYALCDCQLERATPIAGRHAFGVAH